MGKTNGKKKSVLTRKEHRKQERVSKKLVKREKHEFKAPANGSKGPIRIALEKKQREEREKQELIDKKASSMTSTSSKKRKKGSSNDRVSFASSFKPLEHGDAAIDAEDKEIKRLEKLLGVSNDRKKAATKLDKQYADFEGIAGLGTFLMQLDDLDDMITGKAPHLDRVFAKTKTKTAKKTGNAISDEDDDGNSDDDSSVEEFTMPRLLDDSEQEVSDVDESISEDDDGDDVSESDTSDGGEDIEDEQDSEEEVEVEVDDEMEEEEEDEEDDENSDSDEEDDEDEDSNKEDDEDTGKRDDAQWDKHSYRPIHGEDLYGRTITTAPSGDAGGKYIPPALRVKMSAESITKVDKTPKSNINTQDVLIDESSETIKMLRKQINACMNRLSDQNKDNTVATLRKIFESNSSILSSFILKDALLAVCANETQVMASLIPLYAGIIAALHFTMSSSDAGSYIVEALANKLHSILISDSSSTQQQKDIDSARDHVLISSKLSSNVLLLLIYLYGLKVLHHQMIIDFLKIIANMTEGKSQSDRSAKTKELSVDRLELLSLGIEHCGIMLRTDDPSSLKDIISTLTIRLRDIVHLEEEGETDDTGSSRAKYFLETITDLKNNKSRRTQNAHVECISRLKKWIGTVKASIHGGNSSSSSGSSTIRGTAGTDIHMLRIALQDILDADTKGRWWQAGAAWAGRASRPEENKMSSDRDMGENDEENKLLKLAIKMKMNTATRRNIFLVIMSATDVHDAFERIVKLALRGKDDREVVRVLIECCGQEKTYNAFYSELGCLLCASNRQYRMSFQYAIWDAFKLMYTGSVSNRRTVNLARLMAALTTAFHLPMSALKVIELNDLRGTLTLFMASFFLDIFSAPIDEHTYQTLLDRVAATPDFSQVRESLLLFLKRDMKTLPSGLGKDGDKNIKKRRKLAISVFEKMEILNMVRGEDDDLID